MTHALLSQPLFCAALVLLAATPRVAAQTGVPHFISIEFEPGPTWRSTPLPAESTALWWRSSTSAAPTVREISTKWPDESVLTVIGASGSSGVIYQQSATDCSVSYFSLFADVRFKGGNQSDRIIVLSSLDQPLALGAGGKCAVALSDVHVAASHPAIYVEGGPGDDFMLGGEYTHLSGNDGNDWIAGAATMDGGPGDDRLFSRIWGKFWGGDGNDSLCAYPALGAPAHGGAGHDTFYSARVLPHQLRWFLANDPSLLDKVSPFAHTDIETQDLMKGQTARDYCDNGRRELAARFPEWNPLVDAATFGRGPQRNSM